nr:tumor protein p53-inducible protein 11 isoform X1 [Cavia porcellus]
MGPLASSWVANSSRRTVLSEELAKQVLQGRATWPCPSVQFCPWFGSQALPERVAAPPAGGSGNALAGALGAQFPSPSAPAPAATSGARQPGAWEGTVRHWLARGTRGGTCEAARVGRARRRRTPTRPALPCPGRLARRRDVRRRGPQVRPHGPPARGPAPGTPSSRRPGPALLCSLPEPCTYLAHAPLPRL